MKCGRRDFQSSRRPAVPLDDDPKASLPSACALQPWQSSRCSTLAKVLHHGRQLGVSGRPVAGQPNNKFRRTHAFLLFVFDILFLGAFRHFVLLRNPLKRASATCSARERSPQSWRNHLETRGLQGQQAARTNRAR